MDTKTPIPSCSSGFGCDQPFDGSISNTAGSNDDEDPFDNARKILSLAMSITMVIIWGQGSNG